MSIMKRYMSMATRKLGLIGAFIALAAALASGTVAAQEDFDKAAEGDFLGGVFSMNGLVRFEAAYKTTGQQAPSNQTTDAFNGVAVRRNAGNPLTGYRTTLDPTDGLLGGLSVGGLLGRPAGVTSSTGVSDTVTRYVPRDEPTMNYHVVRFEAMPTLSWGEHWSVISRVRAVYDPGELGYADFNMGDYDHINGGMAGGIPSLYHGKPNYMGYQVDGDSSPVPLEWSGENYLVDFPALFLQYTDGPLTLRAGNQSVAWGQLLFFRVMDTANGLDLRRHLILDRGLEEYADERASALGLRLTYQVTDQVIGDAFVQKFQPSILPNPNTPYNVVPAQFVVHDRYAEDGMDTKLNYGIRFKGEFGNYTGQAMYTHRYNPLGAFRWTESGVNKALPNSNILGAAFNRYCETVLGSPSGQGCGPQLAQTAFEVAPAGVFSAEEWFDYAGYVRLDALGGLNMAVDEFPAAQQLLAQSIGRDVNAANNELDAFFMAGEGLHGHIERKYFSENIFGIGAGYVTEAEPGSIFDQLIINVEATYTPDRTFTSVDLAQSFDKRDEIQVGLVMEKYQRFSTDFPATYLVFQYLWQKESDLVGFLMDGYGSENFSDQGIRARPGVPTSENPKIIPGVNGANYVVLAALQPLPAYIWELSVASLIDVQGGVLIQPGIQWKPRGDITINAFYNYINGDAWGDNPNKNTLSFLDHMDEFCLRIGYQF